MNLFDLQDKQVQWERKYLIERYGKELCRRMATDPRDVSYSYYSKLFAGYDWSRNEQTEKTETSGAINNYGTVRSY